MRRKYIHTESICISNYSSNKDKLYRHILNANVQLDSLSQYLCSKVESVFICLVNTCHKCRIGLLIVIFVVSSLLFFTTLEEIYNN